MLKPSRGLISRREMLRAGGIGVGASLGLVGTSAADDDVVPFDQPITITEADSGKTFRQVADITSDTVVVQFEMDATIEDVTIDGNGYTIVDGRIAGNSALSGSLDDIEIRNVHLDGGSISLQGVGPLTLRNNVVDAVDIWYASDVRIVDNTIVSEGRGGGLSFTENLGDSVIENNVVSGIGMSIDDYGSHRIADNVVFGGIFYQNASGSPEGMDVLRNYLTEGGIYLEGAYGYLEIAQNTVVGSPRDGLNNVDSTVDELVGNSFIDNSERAVRAPVYTATDNIAAMNGSHGFELWSSGYVRRNLAVGNGGDGFVAEGNGVYQRNVATTNGDAGFRLRRLDDAKLKFNRSTGNDGDGVILDESTGNRFRRNLVTSNGGSGVTLTAATGNDLTGNNVCANTGEAVAVDDESTGNRFANNVTC